MAKAPTYLTLIILLLNQIVFSQTLTFIEKNDTLQKPKYQEFIYLNDNTNSTDSKRVATIQANGSLKKPELLYQKIKEAAQKLGANSFKFLSFRKIDTVNGELVLQTYYTTEAVLGANFENNPKNSIYIFGDADLTSIKSQSYKVNGEKYEIAGGYYKEFSLNAGQELKVSKGGFTGMTLWFQGEENKHSSFLSFSGIGLAGGTYMPPGGVGVNITTGRINKMEANLALLFLRIYSEQKN